MAETLNRQYKCRYITRAHCKDAALKAAEKKAHKFTRVGDEFFVWLDGVVARAIAERVQSQPSKGQTIR